MEGGKGVVGIRDLFRWVGDGDGRESSSGQKGGGTKDLAVLELLFPGPWVTGGGRDERPRRSPFELRYLARCPSSRKVTFFWEVDFFEFLFLLKNLGCGEEREQSFGPLSLSSS